MPHNSAPTSQQHLLIIRFSSYGDIVHAIGVPAAFKAKFPNSRVDWLVRDDLKGLVTNHPQIDRVISFERRLGWWRLLGLAWSLAGEDYSHVYDAHSNVRSFFVRTIFRLRSRASVLTRSKERFQRWLLFRTKKSRLPKPFRAADSFHSPLTAWGLAPTVPMGRQYHSFESLPADVAAELRSLPKPVIALAPSAAWEMKRWPITHWAALMTQVEKGSFVLLGGPSDRFIDELMQSAPTRTRNFVGRLSLAQTAAVLAEADLVIANDTGVMQVADQMERPTIALIGPTAFGYPSHPLSRTLEIELWCKPCSKDGRGRCVNDLYKRCLVDLAPERVAAAAKEMMR